MSVSVNQSPVVNYVPVPSKGVSLLMRVWRLKVLLLFSVVVLSGASSASAQIQRLLGLDISAWQGNISQTTWNNIRTNDNRRFIILRSSRGGTTGYYNQSDADNSDGLNTLSQRYDDPYYIQNMNRVTAAGMFAGSYHFSRPDVVASTLNSGGIPNNGTDEADHFIQMAGPFMRPGYLVPVHDLEAGDGARTDSEMAQFCIDFSNRIYEKLGIRPAIYINGNYAANIIGGATLTLRNQMAQPSTNSPSVVSPCYPILWSARWPNGSGNQYTGDIQTDQPHLSYAPIYGPWDDYGVTTPWVFWQYSSGERLPSFNSGNSNLDGDVLRGGIEFLKDQLTPAVWMHDGNGDWSTMTNWNSGQTPIAPVQGAGQVARVGPVVLPTPRLPGGTDTNAVTSGTNDTVILERPNANVTVTLSSGTHNIRKLYVRETLNVVGGSLTVHYAPSADSTTNGAQFSGSVTLSNAAAFSVHTLQVDTNRTFTLAGGTVTFNTMNLMPHNSTPGKLLVNGSVALNALNNVTAVIAKGSGAGTSGSIDLAGQPRALTVGNGNADVDLSAEVPISNGGLTKAGTGTLRLTSANTYAGGTILSLGRMLVNNPSGSGTGSGTVTVNGGVLGGTGTMAGALMVNAGGTVSPGLSIGTLTFNSSATFGGTNFMEIDRNGGSPLADKIVASGMINYGGTLVVTNAGAALAGGEVFTLFQAPSYSGAFGTTILPALNNGMNWYLGGLTVNGTIKVNRKPVANLLAFTNTAPNVLQIPFATLVANATDADGNPLVVSGVDLTTTNGITLTTNATEISYANLASVTDQFSYTISDGNSGSATGLVSIVNIAPPPNPPLATFTNWPSFNGDAFTLHFLATPGHSYYVERSTNLADWNTISTNVAPPSGLVDFTDNFQDLGAPATNAFYRLRWTP